MDNCVVPLLLRSEIEIGDFCAQRSSNKRERAVNVFPHETHAKRVPHCAARDCFNNHNHYYVSSLYVVAIVNNYYRYPVSYYRVPQLFPIIIFENSEPQPRRGRELKRATRPIDYARTRDDAE